MAIHLVCGMIPAVRQERVNRFDCGGGIAGPIGTLRRRNQMQATMLAVHLVPGMRLFASDCGCKWIRCDREDAAKSNPRSQTPDCGSSDLISPSKKAAFEGTLALSPTQHHTTPHGPLYGKSSALRHLSRTHCTRPAASRT
eukprot:2500143-Rhodomonas_salina.1